MRTRFKLALLATALLAIALFHSRFARACGPDFPEIIFVNTQHPDLPIGPYTNGDLGVLQPSYSSIYLYVAYHVLTGQPFSQAQQVALWDDNTALTKGESIDRMDRLQEEDAFLARSKAHGQSHWESEWFSAIGQPDPGPPFHQGFIVGWYQPVLGIYKQTGVSQPSGFVSYSGFLNCQQDAFHYALTTLQRLSDQFGKSSPGVQGWIRAQQTVFDNCTDGDDIPKPLSPKAPAVLRQARAYQIAAAHFYSGNYGDAASEFRAIGQNTSSPWSTVAPYLVARALVRKATQVEYPNGPDLSTLAQAEAQVDAVLANPRYAQYHHAAEKLRGFIEFRLHPRQRLVELANKLTNPVELANKLANPMGDPDLHQDVTDFTLLFPEVREEGVYAESQPVYPGIYAKLADLRAKSDLIDWLLTFKLDSPEAFDHAYEKWKETHSDAWLVAALTKASPNDPRVPELLTSRRIELPVPEALDSVTFQRFRLMLLRGEKNAVRKQLAAFLAQDQERMNDLGGTPPSALNLFAAIRFALARSLGELYAAAPRKLAEIADTSESGEMPAVDSQEVSRFEPRFDDDALMVFNRYLSVALLAEAVENQHLPENLRREIAMAAWTKAALLGEAAVARSLSPAVETFEPEMRASVHAYNSAKTLAARRFTAALDILRFPGLRPYVEKYPRGAWNSGMPLGQIEDYRDNWWGTRGPFCGPDQVGLALPSNWPVLDSVLQTIYPGGKMKPPAFLTACEDAEAAREWQRLLAMSPAPDYLSTQVLAWARAHPSDPRVPEALALAVKSTRFGCADQKTGALSRAAFNLLHSRYPKSSWTDKTKYWFKM